MVMVFQGSWELCYWFIKCGNAVDKNCINSKGKGCRMVLDGKNGLYLTSREEGMTCGLLVLFAFGHRQGAAWMELW